MTVEFFRTAIPAHDLIAALKAGEDGAVVVFDGIVRNHTRGRQTLFLDYESYEQMALEQMRLVWPAYFADPEQAPPMPALRMASECSAQLGRSILAQLPALEAGLPRIRVPVGFVHGSPSPVL